MMELLHACQELVIGLLTWAWGLVVLVSTFCWSMLHGLHVGSPRLEGLLVGVALTWLMLRRDKHPALRVLSAPLKLIIDVLDLAWDQVVEFVTDAWTAVWGWVTGTYGWCKAKLLAAGNLTMKLLSAVKEKLAKKG
jgi:hypothetical protein